MLYALEEQRSRKHQEVSLLAEKLGAWEASGQGNVDYDRNKKFQERMKHVREKAEVDKCVRQERIQQAEMNVAAAADEVVLFSESTRFQMFECSFRLRCACLKNS